MSADGEKIIFSMMGISKTINKKSIIKDISLSFYYGAKIGVLGLNGAGKSTVLRIIAGEDSEYEGQVQMAKGFSTGYLEQEPLRNESRTVLEVVQEGAGKVMGLLEEFESISERFAQEMSPEEMESLLEKQGEVQDEIERLGGWEIESRLEQAMDALRCPPPDQSCSTLSGGEKRRVALCRLLLSEPDILLLDEPTNHLDAESVQWLEQHLARFPGTIIAVTHDRYFLDNVAGWILELDRGEGIPWKGNYSSWLEQKDARLALEAKQAHKRRRALQRELEWVRQNPQGRQAKNKARLNAYDAMASEEQSKRSEEIELYIPPGPRLGSQVIEAVDIAKGFDEKLLYDNLSFNVPANAIVGVVGPNGAGKTTLFRMVLGTETPDAGSFQVGSTVKLGYVEQGRDSIPEGLSIWEAISDGDEEIKLGSLKLNSRAYVARFGFTGTDQQKICDDLSGGERNRVHLARMLRSEANVLLLDEPTNDLDVNIMRSLEEAILNFAGCALVISHDRWFLDRIATHILAFEGDSNVVWFPGNWSAYEDDRKRRLGESANRPTRIKYRKLTRS
ncbi:MAG: energy-dependent translational throttle protein EttA [Planctomycetes bacterium TMED75]|nr:energy-dependent translational throttle protein EttA [Planctomycetaceae bacterium]OUU94205.1 MAG: energy-dependent translational throttle protein EttA [Planctomycetes bacterium TMED75]